MDHSSISPFTARHVYTAAIDPGPKGATRTTTCTSNAIESAAPFAETARTAKGAVMSAAKTVIGGDDVRAIVVDCGSWAVRAGSAGDDAPRSVVPCAAGVRDSMSDAPEGTRDFAAGDRVVATPLAFTDIASVYDLDRATGAARVTDWDAMQAVWDASFAALRLETASSPLMIVEPSRPWTQEERAKSLERAFEGCGVPAAYVARGSAMAAFAAARTTACVLDIGHQGATTVPVVEGYALQKATRSSLVGGHFLSEKLYDWVEGRLVDVVDGISNGSENAEGNGSAERDVRTPAAIGAVESHLRAMHEVRRTKRPVGSSGSPFVVEDLSKLDTHAGVSNAHRAFYRMRLLDDMKASTFRVSQSMTSSGGPNSSSTAAAAGKNGNGTPSKADGAATDAMEQQKNGAEDPAADGSAAPDTSQDKEVREKNREKDPASQPLQYELPDGNVLSLEQPGRTNIADMLFENDSADTMRCAISNMVFEAVSACDVDVRRDMFNGVVLTGGSSLIPGTIERFTREMSILTPQAYKLKVISSQSNVERTSGPWIGGSIVASLGTFQQAWISKAQYDELGSMGALRKCP